MISKRRRKIELQREETWQQRTEKSREHSAYTLSKSYLRSLQFKSTIMTFKLFSSFENVQLKIKARSTLSNKDVVNEEEKLSFNEKRLDKEELRSQEDVQLKIKARSILSNQNVVDEEEKLSFEKKRLDKEELRSHEDVQLKIKARSTLNDKDVVNEEGKLSFKKKRLGKRELRRLEYVDNDIDQENVHQNLSQWVHERKMSINLIESSQLHHW